MARQGAAAARLLSPPLLARFFTVRALAWAVLAGTAFAAAGRGSVPPVPAYLFAVACAVGVVVDGLWALQAWGLAPIATARIDAAGMAHVRIVSVRPCPRISVRMNKKGEIPSTIRESALGNAGLSRGWPTLGVLVFESPQHGEVARLVPHGEVAWRHAPAQPAT